MYFYKQQGKQCLDLSGNLILSYNDHLVKARSKSAAPAVIKNPLYVINMGESNIITKIKTTFRLIKFVWIKPKNLLKPIVNKTIIKKTTSIGISSTVESQL